ncbi:MAG: InlB B-repeat-containing protein [Christensenellales bacterium]
MKKKIVVMLLLVFCAAIAFAGFTVHAASDNPFSESDNLYNEHKKNVLKVNSVQQPENGKAAKQDALKAKNLATGKRFIVKFNDDVMPEQVYELIKDYDYKVIGKSENRIFAITTDDIASLTQKLVTLTEYVEEDTPVKLLDSENIKPIPANEDASKLLFAPNDPDYPNQWYPAAIHAPDAWDHNQGTDDIYVAVIDSGIDWYQPDLRYANICNGADLILGGICDWDSVGHGTNVTGIIAAPLNNGIGIAGISPNVSIVPFLVCYPDGTAYSSDVAQALHYAADCGCKVINLSLGGSTNSTVVNEAIDYAHNAGCIIVAAAGNDGNATLSYPASNDGVISVGSLDSALTYSVFSNYNDKVDVIAPGEDILTTDCSYYTGSDYGSHNGTSFSAPCVSALAALAASYDEDITPDEFEIYLEATCTDLGTAGYDVHYGNGLVDADALLWALYYNDADLNDVALTNGTLAPSFSCYITDYNLAVPLANGSFTVTPIPVNGQASYKIDNQQAVQMSYTLDYGESRDITIDVTSASGTVQKQYAFHASRPARPTFSVTFSYQSGAADQSIQAPYDTAVSAPEQPARAGYIFGGWYREPGCLNAWNFDTDRVTGNMTLYAKWTLQTACTVTFDSQGGTAVASKTVKSNTAVRAPRSPLLTGYKFKGWYREPACVSTWNFRTKVTEDMTLYAKWAPNTYKVTFKTQGGRPVAAKKALFDTTIPAPLAPTRTGYTFDGWYKEAVCVNPWVFETDKVLGNTSLYAKWIINIYTIAFDSRGGTPIETISAPYNSRINAPAPPELTGYTFKGWYKDPACRRSWNFRAHKVGAQDMVLYAKWAINIYKVTFNTQGGSAAGQRKVQYNALLPMPKTPIRKGYTFSGWYCEPECINAWNFGSDTITYDRTLYAKWTVNMYTVTFNTMGGTPIEPAAVQHGATAAEPAPPAKEGYTFSGWYKDPACRTAWNFAVNTVTGNCTLYAKWI